METLRKLAHFLFWTIITFLFGIDAFAVAPVRSAKDFLPAGAVYVVTAEGDLNNDGLKDFAGVFETQVDGHITERTLLIAFKRSDGFYAKSIATEKAILNVWENEPTGLDPLARFDIENGSLIFAFYGGRVSTVTETFKFRYQDNDWYLIGSTNEYHDATCSCEYLTDINWITGMTKFRETDSEGISKESWTKKKRGSMKLRNFDIRKFRESQ